MPYSVAIIGLGYVGLPLAVEAAKVGHKVSGIDIDDKLINNLKVGKILKSELRIIESDLKKCLDRGNIKFSSNFEVITNSEIVIVCLPTPLDNVGEPDMSILISGVKMASEYICPNNLLVIESTVYPGATEEMVLGIFGKSLPKIGYSPERIDPSNKVFKIHNTPKIIAANDIESLAKMRLFYNSFIEEIHEVDSIKTAEFAKLIENIYRLVNISLVNELLLIGRSLNLNTRAAIRAAGTKPFGFQEFTPGIGAGGHCIPVDPVYLRYKVALRKDIETVILNGAIELNRKMPEYVSKLISEISMKKFKTKKRGMGTVKVLIYGVSYKSGVQDTRHSQAFYLREKLIRSGFIVRWYDVNVLDWLDEKRENNLTEIDLVVILNYEQSEFLQEIVSKENLTILDCTGNLKSSDYVYIL
jgi:UDP-N-acetyl-D-glucosamine dehydrogenase